MGPRHSSDHHPFVLPIFDDVPEELEEGVSGIEVAVVEAAPARIFADDSGFFLVDVEPEKVHSFTPSDTCLALLVSHLHSILCRASRPSM